VWERGKATHGAGGEGAYTHTGQNQRKGQDYRTWYPPNVRTMFAKVVRFYDNIGINLMSIASSY